MGTARRLSWRVLYRKGLLWPKFIEIALTDIAQTDFAHGTFGFGDRVNVRKLNYVNIEIILVPRLEDLRDAILTLKGQTVPPKFNRRYQNAINMMMLLAIGCGLLGVVGFSIVFISVIGSADSLTGASNVAIIIFAIFLFIPLVLLALALGFIVGSILFFILARFYLSSAETKELICMDDGALRRTWMKTLNRRCVGYLERMVSFLYGQKIRCD